VKRVLAPIILLLASVSPAAAQPPQLPQLPGFAPDAAERLKKISNAMVDLSVPPSPAFNVLGLTPENIDHPTSARRLATALVNGVDRQGQLQTGIAIDTAPYLLAFGDRITLTDYAPRPMHNRFDHYIVRLLSRFSVSAASAKATGSDDKAIRVALGFRLTIWDNGDPRTDSKLLDCFTTELPALPGPPATLEEAQSPARQVLLASFAPRWAAAAEACREKARNRNWNNSSWIVAGAPTFFSGDGSLSNLDASGGGVWTTVAYGFENVPGLQDSAQLSFHARLRDGEQVANEQKPGSFLERDSRLFGVQLRAGTVDTTVAFEVLRDRSRFGTASFGNHTRVGLAFERKLAENLWLNLALGEGSERPAGQSASSYLLTSLRWGFSQTRTLPIPTAGGTSSPQ
jgi:hypothetical protein